jgi:hypothetical protein
VWTLDGRREHTPLEAGSTGGLLRQGRHALTGIAQSVGGRMIEHASLFIALFVFFYMLRS